MNDIEKMIELPHVIANAVGEKALKELSNQAKQKKLSAQSQ